MNEFPHENEANHDNGGHARPPFGIVWWIKHVTPIILGVFFLLFGIQMMVAAYRLDNPFVFVMTFFSSSFIILISLAIAGGMVYRILWFVRQSDR